jgi:zinc transporter ZupT
LLSWPIIDRLDPPRLGLLLAFSAGTLLYVGATHLLPRATDRRDGATMAALAAGAATGVGLTLFAA